MFRSSPSSRDSSKKDSGPNRRAPQLRTPLACALACAILASIATPIASAQQQNPPANPQSTTPDSDSGGPTGDNGPIVVPKKKAQPEDTPPPAPVEPKLKNPVGLPPVTLRIEVPEVTVDVGVLLEKTHQFVPGLKPENFRIYEDGQEQKVIGFKRVEAPITAVLLCEFAANNNYEFIYNMRNAAFGFANQLRPQDYVALITFDLRTQIVTDFTQDKRSILESINDLRVPGFRETDLFDALYESLDRVSRIDGQKYIILIASGLDTFSKIPLNKILDKVKKTPDVTIFTVSTSQIAQIQAGARGGMAGQSREMDYLQADNQMRTFANMTGGMFFAPRFVGEMPDDFNAINSAIRSKYELIYHPSNSKQDGSYRRIKVGLVDAEGHPLQIQDEKHKPLKYDLVVRDGYNAKQEVE